MSYEISLLKYYIGREARLRKNGIRYLHFNYARPPDVGLRSAR